MTGSGIEELVSALDQARGDYFETYAPYLQHRMEEKKRRSVQEEEVTNSSEPGKKHVHLS